MKTLLLENSLLALYSVLAIGYLYNYSNTYDFQLAWSSKIILFGIIFMSLGILFQLKEIFSGDRTVEAFSKERLL